MAQRLATEYVKTCLEIKEAEMPEFFKLFEEQQAQLRVRILENGSQEVAITDGEEDEIVLSFERKSDHLVCSGSCRLGSLSLANAMRRAVSRFKGDAVVNRIYSHCVMMYVYKQGKVVKISELKRGQENVVYEYKDTVGQLEQLYMKKEVEREIGVVQAQINHLLDLRNGLQEPEIVHHIDERLAGLTHKLFVMEA